MEYAGKILTWRPGNKKGVYVNKGHYEKVSRLILKLVRERRELGLGELIEEARNITLKPTTDIAWVLLHVKSDLQARGLIDIAVIGPDRKQVIRRGRRRKFSLPGFSWTQ